MQHIPILLQLVNGKQVIKFHPAFLRHGFCLYWQGQDLSNFSSQDLRTDPRNTNQY